MDLFDLAETIPGPSTELFGQQARELGVAILVIQKDFTLIESIVYAFSTAIGFALALVLFAGIREQLAYVNIPKGMRGMPIVLVAAGLLSLAFMGFSGVDLGLKALFGLK